MRVQALFELNRRELLPLLLLGRHLRAMGVEVEIEQLKLASHPLGTPRGMASDSVRLIPFLYDDSNVHNSLAYARWTGEAALNLCWEQFRSSWNRKLIPTGTMVEAGMHFIAWGERFASLLVDSGIPAAQVHRTGNLRFDLSHHRELLFDRSLLARRYGLDTGKPWLLIPWNLHLAGGDTSQSLKRICRRFKLPMPHQMIRIARETRDYFFELFNRISAEFSSYEIILRAHPSGDDVRELRERLGSKFDNVHTINEFDIANWIVQSDVVLGWSSTSLLEAIGADIPAVCFEPVPYSEPLDYDVGRIVPRATTIDELMDLLREPAALPRLTNGPLMQEWFGPIDGRVHERVAGVCASILQSIDQHRIPTDICRSKTSPWKNTARRVLRHAPHLAPVLGPLAHGRHAHSNRWIPRSHLERVLHGESIEQLQRWLA